MMIFHLDAFRHRIPEDLGFSRCLSAAGAMVVPVAAVVALGAGLVGMASPQTAASSPAIALASEDGNGESTGDHDASTAPSGGVRCLRMDESHQGPRVRKKAGA